MPHALISGIATLLFCFLWYEGHGFQWDTNPQSGLERSANIRSINTTETLLDLHLGQGTMTKQMQQLGTQHIAGVDHKLLFTMKDLFFREIMVTGNVMLIILACMLALAVCFWISPQARECIDASMDSASAGLIGSPLPDFVMTLIDRTDTRATDLAALGKPMVFRFYESKSKDVQNGSSSSITAFDEMAQDVKYYNKVLFVLVAVDHPGTTDLEECKRKLNISDQCIHGELKRGWDSSLEEYGVTNGRLPHTTIAGANGVVVKNFDAFGMYLVDVRQCVDDLLKGNEMQPKTKSARTTSRQGRRH